MGRRLDLALAFALAIGAYGCDPDPVIADAGADAGPPPVAAPLVEYGTGDLWDAPWPDERLRRADGTVDVQSFPNPLRSRIVTQLVAFLDDADGFGVSSAIYFPFTAPIDGASLPDIRGSLDEGASVFLVDVDPDSPERGTRWPVDVAFLDDPGPFVTGAHVLAMIPLQGRPLRADRLYAAVVTTAVRRLGGGPIGIADATAQLARGERPPGLSDAAYEAHGYAMDTLADRTDIAASAVFRTWDPTIALRDAREQLLAGPAPTVEADFTAAEVFDGFCVYQTTIRMPDFQSGEPPYSAVGGEWIYERGSLVLQNEAQANVWVSLPRGPMPAGGFPIAVFIRTGGGGDRPLVDRGPRATPGGPAITPGTGPALHFARAGFAGISVDGPLGGLRNAEGWDEQFAIFNINNIPALRDNVRQSALELMHLIRLIPSVAIDASGCPDLTTPAGDGAVRFDDTFAAIMGHSMGATIAPLVVALEPRYRAMILSGAGGSWSRNIIFKESPIAVRPAAEGLLRYTGLGRTLVEHDPSLALLQWAGEPADPQVYAHLASGGHVLMFQGILDTYIPPPVANPLSLALGLDLAGEELDRTLSDPRYRPLGDLIDLAGGATIPLPASGNRAMGSVTRVVVQAPEDGIEDGHEVVFQTPEPQVLYRCFLESLIDGVPSVPAFGATRCE